MKNNKITPIKILSLHRSTFITFFILIFLSSFFMSTSISNIKDKYQCAYTVNISMDDTFGDVKRKNIFTDLNSKIYFNLKFTALKINNFTFNYYSEDFFSSRKNCYEAENKLSELIQNYRLAKVSKFKEYSNYLVNNFKPTSDDLNFQLQNKLFMIIQDIENMNKMSVEVETIILEKNIYKIYIVNIIVSLFLGFIGSLSVCLIRSYRLLSSYVKKALG